MYVVALAQPYLGPLSQFLAECHSVRYWENKALPEEIYGNIIVIMFFAFVETNISIICATSVAYTGILMYTYISTTNLWLDFIK